jgi:hypothetical protein
MDGIAGLVEHGALWQMHDLKVWLKVVKFLGLQGPQEPIPPMLRRLCHDTFSGLSAQS